MKILVLFFLGLSLASARNVRIIGGELAKAGQHPYAAAISYSTSNGNYFCGGSLISNQWILTAAHCVKDAIQFTIILGSGTVDGSDSSAQEFSTLTSVAHPDFNAETLENDAGLIELRLPASFSDYIRPIELPKNEVQDYAVVVAIGWGQTSDEQAGLSQHLYRITITALPNSECKLVYGNQIVDTMVCVEGNLNEGACNGDLGGPLIQYRNQRTAQVVGISSFVSGRGCESTDPSGYTRVYPLLDWIETVTGLTN